LGTVAESPTNQNRLNHSLSSRAPEQEIILRRAGWLRDEMKSALWKTAGSGQSHFSQVTQILFWSNLTIHSIYLTIT